MLLYEVHRAFVLGAASGHVDETPVNMPDPGSGKTKRAYVWAYARSSFGALPDVVCDFCIGRAAKYPIVFLKGWSGTLVCDGYKAYERVLKLEACIEAGCMAHAKRKFDELYPRKIRARPPAMPCSASPGCTGLRRMRGSYRRTSAWPCAKPGPARFARNSMSGCAWSASACPTAAPSYSLNCWTALTAHLNDGNVAIDNNPIENLKRPWAMGRKAWLFAGSELAGQRAAVVMSLVQSARKHGLDPGAYLKDVLVRLPGHLTTAASASCCRIAGNLRAETFAKPQPV